MTPTKGITRSASMPTLRLHTINESTDSFDSYASSRDIPAIPEENSSPDAGSDDSFATANSNVLDDVPEDPEDSADYMVPRTRSMSSMHSFQESGQRRSLPRVPASQSLQDVRTAGWGWGWGNDLIEEIPAVPKIPSTLSEPICAYMGYPWPTPAEVTQREDMERRVREGNKRRNRKNEEGERMSRTSSLSQRAKDFFVKTLGFKAGRNTLRKVRARRPRFRRSSPARKDSADTFELRTQTKKLEHKPSMASKTKLAARGVKHAIATAPAATSQVAEQAATQTAKGTTSIVRTVRKRASRTKMRICVRVETSKDKAVARIPGVRPKRVVRKSVSMPENIRPTPSQVGQSGRFYASQAATEQNSDVDIRPASPAAIKVREDGRLPDHAKPKDAVFAPMRATSVAWRALKAEVPLIIVTGDDNHEVGELYLPINEQGQIVLKVDIAKPREENLEDLPPLPESPPPELTVSTDLIEDEDEGYASSTKAEAGSFDEESSYEWAFLQHAIATCSPTTSEGSLSAHDGSREGFDDEAEETASLPDSWSPGPSSGEEFEFRVYLEEPLIVDSNVASSGMVSPSMRMKRRNTL